MRRRGPAARGRAAAGRQADGGEGVPARPRRPSGGKMRGADRVAPARRAAFEVLRRTFEEDAWADRALPAAVRRHGLDARDRALAQRLAYGTIQRRATLDHLIAVLAERPAADIDPPLDSALRLELSEGGAPVRHSATPPMPPESLIATGPIGEALGRRIDAGELVPQSRASAFVVAVLDPRPGERVLDLCAGPGIKTTQIAARMRDEGELIAVEADPRRAAELHDLCGRLGASGVRVLEADAAEDDLGGGYDRVLVDPPCSDLGTLASRPDARWRKSGERIVGLARLQAAILGRAAETLRPGGTLVYSTCTVSRRENEDPGAGGLGQPGAAPLAGDLGRGHPPLPSRHDRRFVQTRPDRDRTDGFFIARLR